MNTRFQMVKNRRYRITHTLGEGTRPYVSVMTYLGDDIYGEPQFNARPAAGTQSLPPSWIRYVVEVGEEVPHSVNEPGQ